MFLYVVERMPGLPLKLKASFKFIEEKLTTSKFLFSVHNRYIVTGDVAGHVRFLDQQLRLTNWLSIECGIEVNDYLLICVLKSKSLKGA